MTLPSAATKTNFDQGTDDPRVSYTEFASLVDKFNQVLTHLGLSIVTSGPVTPGEAIEQSGSTLRVQLNGSTLLRSSSGLSANVGTGASKIVQLDSSSRLPAADGSALTGVIGVVTGGVIMWGGSSAPTGFLLCNGAEVSRTTYSALFTIMGTTYGVGDGSTTFNLPDLRSRTGIGSGTGAGLTARTLGATHGVETVMLSEAELPVHNHDNGTITVDVESNHLHYMHRGNTPTNGSARNQCVGNNFIAGHTFDTAQHTHPLSGNTSSIGGNNAHNNMQPSLGVNFIIKT